MRKLKGVCIGTGYFSQYHYDAWNRIPEVSIVALSSLDEGRGKEVQTEYGVPKFYADYREMLLKENPDFVDIITPPSTHNQICGDAADMGINIICQKPLSPDFETSLNLISSVSSKVRFIIHENFRFQPWHREIKKILEQDVIGKLHNLAFRSRMGDGWGKDAYLARQPYFREYDQLLIFETGIHFIDTFRYHAGEVKSVFSVLRQLNPAIRGEDAGLMILEFENGAVAHWDANRYNENNYIKQRFTFGEYLLDGEQGSIRLYSDGTITIQPLGKPEEPHPYRLTDIGFAGDSCFNFQKDVVRCLSENRTAETEASKYLTNLQIQEAVYQSAREHRPIEILDRSSI